LVIPSILLCEERHWGLSFCERRWEVVIFYLLDQLRVYLNQTEILPSVSNKMTDWMTAVMAAYAKMKKKDPKATLTQAMKEAKKTYKPKPKK
jgi:hypothetical protein